MLATTPNTMAIANHNHLLVSSNFGEDYNQLFRIFEIEEAKTEEKFFKLLEKLQAEDRLTPKAYKELAEAFYYFYENKLFDKDKFYFYLTQDESILFKTAAKTWDEEYIIRGEYFFDEEPYELFVGIDTKEKILEGYAGNIKEVLPLVTKFIEKKQRADLVGFSAFIVVMLFLVVLAHYSLKEYLEEE